MSVTVTLTDAQADALYRAHPFGSHLIDKDIHWAGRLAIKAALDADPASSERGKLEAALSGVRDRLERIRDLDEELSDGALGSIARDALDELAAALSTAGGEEAPGADSRQAVRRVLLLEETKDCDEPLRREPPPDFEIGDADEAYVFRGDEAVSIKQHDATTKVEVAIMRRSGSWIPAKDDGEGES